MEYSWADRVNGGDGDRSCELKMDCFAWPETFGLNGGEGGVGLL